MSINISKEFIDYYAPLSAIAAGKNITALSSKNFLGMMSIGNDDNLYLFFYSQEADSKAPFSKICVDDKVSTFKAMRLKGTETFVFAYIRNDQVFVCVTNMPKSISKDTFHPVPLSLIGYENCTPDVLNITGMDGCPYLSVSMKDESGRIKRMIVNCFDCSAVPFPIASNFSKIRGEILGRSPKEEVDGIYTLGEYGGSIELLYTPLFQLFGTTPPAPKRLLSPKNPGEVLSVCPLKNSIGTHLFVAGGGGIAYYPYSMQYDCAHTDNPEPIVVAENNPYISSVTAISSFITDSKIYVYVLSSSGNIYYTFADYNEKEEEAGKFSELLLLKEKCLYFQAIEGKMFICKANQLLFGERDPESGTYRFKEWHLNAETGKFTSFRGVLTKIVTDSPNTEISLQASHSIQAYINGNFFCFTNLIVKSDETCMLDIVQYADSITIEPFLVTVGKEQIQVNPSSLCQERLAKLSTIEGMENAQIKSPNGSSIPLLPKDANKNTVKSAADTISGLLNSPVMKEHTKDFCCRTIIQESMAIHDLFRGYHHTPCLAQQSYENGFQRVNKESKQDFSNSLFFFLDDVFNLLYKAGKEIISFATKIVKNIVEFVIKIGKKVFTFVLDTAWKVLEAVSKILSYIGIPMDKLLDFLKYTFDMDAVIKGKNHLKQVIMNNIKLAVPDVRKAQKKVDEILDKTAKSVAQWAEIEVPEETGRKPLNKPEVNTQSMYLFDIIWRRFDISSMFDVSITVEPSPSLISSSNQFYQVMRAKDVSGIFQSSINGIFTWVSQQTPQIPVKDMLRSLKTIAGMLSVPLIQFTSTIMNAAFDFFIDLLDFTMKIMDQTFHIPILSDILYLLGIEDFSLLDLIILPAAFLSRAIGYFFKDNNKLRTMSENVPSKQRIPDYNTRKDVCLIQTAIFVVETAETIYTAATSIVDAPEKWAENHFVISNLFGIVLTIADFGLCYGSGVLYSPMDIDDFFSVNVYGNLWYAKTALSSILSVCGMFGKKKSSYIRKWCKIILNMCYVFLAITAFVFECIAIDDARNKDCPHGENPTDFSHDKTLLILQASSYLVDEVRNIIDGVMGMLEAWKSSSLKVEPTDPNMPEEPSCSSEVEMIVHIIRAVLSEIYAVLQLSFGITLVSY